MMDAHQINPAKTGQAARAFALAVNPPKPEPIAAGRGGRRGGGGSNAAKPKGRGQR